MGIISRFKDIMASNFNALLDKIEDPEKMIDQYIRNAENDLGQVKAETATVMADKKAAERKLNECDSEIAKMDEYAKKAVMSGDDMAAKQFLVKKGELTSQRTVLEQQYMVCCENEMKMREMYDKLSNDVQSLKTRRDTLKAKVKVAETQQRLNKMSGASKAMGSLGKFDEMEEKINRKLDEADAMATLNGANANMSSIDALRAKYDDGAASAAVDAELEALKASMGLKNEEGGVN